MKWVNKILAALVGFIITYIIGAMFWGVALGAHLEKPDDGLIYVVVTALISVALALFAPTGGKAWRRVFIVCGLLCFALPLASLVSGGVSVANTTESAEAAGAVVGTGLVAGLSGFVGFFFGVIFIVLAYFTGKNPPPEKQAA